MNAPDLFAEDPRRLLEAVLFAAEQPLTTNDLAAWLPDGTDPLPVLEHLQNEYEGRGIALTRAGDTWAFQTAVDLAPSLRRGRPSPRRLSAAMLETLAIIAYRQPVTRADLESVRGVEVSKGVLDALLEQGWIQPQGRRQVPGRPIEWGTTDEFLRAFGLASLDQLPGVEELRAAGFLEGPLAAVPFARAGVDD